MLKKKKHWQRSKRRKKKMKINGTLLGLLVCTLYFSGQVYADEIKFKFKNPSFSGIGTGAHYLTIENQDEIVLGGASLSELYEMGLKKGDLEPYFPVSSDLILDNNIQIHYLGYYIKWHPQKAYYYSVENGGFESSPERTLLAVHEIL